METDNTSQPVQSDAPSVGSLRWSARFLFKVLLPAVCVAAAVFIAMVLVKTGPEAKRQKPPQQARQVTVETLERGDAQATVRATGKVGAARSVSLRPEVSGRVTAMRDEVIPGGLIEHRQELIQIDSRDYETVVKQRENELTRAQLALKLEAGNQKVAAQEYEMLAEMIDESEQELVLRKPQLVQAEANLAAAEAALAKAKLDVKRCTVRAPFNAIIQEKFVDVGAQVSPAGPLLSIIGTDAFWVEVKVRVESLKWFSVPADGSGQGAAVTIFNPTVWGKDESRQGTVLRLLGQLEQKGRRAQLLVSVDDPLCLTDASASKPKLLIDSYVSVEIEGEPLENVFAVNRDYLHDGDFVWVMNDQSRLEIRPVTVVFRGPEVVYITEGVAEGEKIITSEISAPVEGTLLRLEGQAQPQKPEGAGQKKPLPEAQS
ncbi:MAG: efflux RND transporter periplasmic adaptor subunit [Planctomycetota bacterium]|jgi:RND family efflux transporter MFP subunit